MGPNLWDSILGQLAAMALLPGYCPISPALQMWAGQQLSNTKLSFSITDFSRPTGEEDPSCEVLLLQFPDKQCVHTFIS